MASRKMFMYDLMQSIHFLWISMVGSLNCLTNFTGILQYRILKEICLGAAVRSEPDGQTDVQSV
jgi:hypothetical protein